LEDVLSIVLSLIGFGISGDEAFNSSPLTEHPNLSFENYTIAEAMVTGSAQSERH
jgi:hypothetical protein